MKKMYVIRINFYAGMGSTATTFLSRNTEQRWDENINTAKIFNTREEAEAVLEKERARAPKVKDMEVREVRPTKIVRAINELQEI